jgi:ribosomal-protein-serine acetyltransferase
VTLSIRVDDDIKLAPCLERQAGELFSIVDADRENLRSWLPWVDRTKQIEDTREFIRKSLEEYEQGVTVPLGIWYQDQLVGHISLMKIVAKHQDFFRF